jgi:hypothetical protein
MTVLLSSGTEQQASASPPKLLQRFAEFLRQRRLEERLSVRDRRGTGSSKRGASSAAPRLGYSGM